MALALVLAVVTLPLLAAIAVLILLRDGRPVLYGAERMRSPTRGFTLWKFRTMRGVAQDRGVSGGDKRDRITRSGRWLRTTRLDELPQLWNILRGDMGFVGPRPPLRQYVERFPALYARVLQSRPGVTGLASLVFHRHEARLLAQATDAEETDRIYARRCVPRKARLDLIYQRHRTLCTDMRMILATGAVLLGRRGRWARRR
nr:sugar transferase [Frigidibacter sp. ROC022]